MTPVIKPPHIISVAIPSDRPLARSSHSRLGSRKPAVGGRFCFSRRLCKRYMIPAKNPTNTATVPSSKKMPWARPQIRGASSGANGREGARVEAPISASTPGS